jgi:hypothetical protein
VALVLNPLTGYVSPQFHVVFDPTFGTVSGKVNNPLPRCLWQAKCGLTRASASRYAHTHKNEAPPEIIGPGLSSVGGRTSDVDAELEGREETTATENQNDAETTTNTSQDQVTLIAAAKDRTTQDDDQLFTCLMESITKAA